MKHSYKFDYYNFFHGTPDTATENAVAAEKSQARDAYCDEHGDSTDERYSGYSWVYGTLIKNSTDDRDIHTIIDELK